MDVVGQVLLNLNSSLFHFWILVCFTSEACVWTRRQILESRLTEVLNDLGGDEVKMMIYQFVVSPYDNSYIAVVANSSRQQLA